VLDETVLLKHNDRTDATIFKCPFSRFTRFGSRLWDLLQWRHEVHPNSTKNLELKTTLGSLLVTIAIIVSQYHLTTWDDYGLTIHTTSILFHEALLLLPFFLFNSHFTRWTQSQDSLQVPLLHQFPNRTYEVNRIRLSIGWMSFLPSKRQCQSTEGSIKQLRYRNLHCKKYPYIHRYFTASFPHFNGTGSVHVCIHKSTE